MLRQVGRQTTCCNPCKIRNKMPNCILWHVWATTVVGKTMNIFEILIICWVMVKWTKLHKKCKLKSFWLFNQDNSYLHVCKNIALIGQNIGLTVAFHYIIYLHTVVNWTKIDKICKLTSFVLANQVFRWQKCTQHPA